jgi:hypothetical protein
VIQLDELRHRLRTDPRVATPHLEVLDLGDRILVTGAVESGERRRAVDEVIAELAPGRRIDNHTQIGEPPEPDEQLETEF